MRLLTLGNPKTAKGAKYGYHTGILHLHPDADNCQWWTDACRRLCLNTAGRAGIIKAGETTNMILEARKRRTRDMRRDPVRFQRDLFADLGLLRKQATRLRLKPAVRLNGTSDRDWIRYANAHPGLQFYDYTKSRDRMWSWLRRELPSNYHLTFSRSESNWTDCKKILDSGGNVAVVTMTGDYLNGPVYGSHLRVDGDQHDLTFLHPAGSILVLRAKGRARKDTSGFVLDC